MREFAKNVLGIMVGNLIGLVLVLVLFAWMGIIGCAKEPEPEGVSDWRRCAEECPAVFLINFGTDPPTCTCRELFGPEGEVE